MRRDQKTDIGLNDICLLHKARLDQLEAALFLSGMLEVRAISTASWLVRHFWNYLCTRGVKTFVKQ